MNISDKKNNLSFEDFSDIKKASQNDSFITYNSSR